MGKYYGKITSIRETDKGTDLIYHIPNEKLGNKIVKYQHDGEINAYLKIDDKRVITSGQRKKIFATIRDISNFTGQDREELREYFTRDFSNILGIKPFSLGDDIGNIATIDTARYFINYLIDFILKEDIPLSDLALRRTEDIDNYLYGCIKYKRCCLCGKKADIHHEEAIGMGLDRLSYDDSNHKKIALCREHHTEAHKIGVDSFRNRYRVYGVKVDEKDFKEWYEV